MNNHIFQRFCWEEKIMNKIIIGAVSVIMILSMAGMASPFTIDVTKAIPNQGVSAGSPINVTPGTTYYSLNMSAMVNASDMFNITVFNIIGAPAATIALNYSPPGPIILMDAIGHLHPDGMDPYIAPNAFNVTIPANAPDGTIYTFTLAASSLNIVGPGQHDNASASRTLIVVNRANISGMKFNDLNNNGAKNAGEPGLSGWTIVLKNQSTGAVITTTLTDGNGNYKFLDQPTGNYTVEEVLKAGWTQTFPASKTYNVTLVFGVDVTGLDFGNFNQPLVANFTFIAGSCDRTVTFNASSSFDPSAIVNYHWNFGDGTSEDRANNASFTHTYASGGTKSVNLTVTDNNGKTNSTIKSVFVNDPPTASLTANKSIVNPGEWVQFDASGSSDPNGDTLTFKWDFDNDGIFNESGPEANAFNKQKVSLFITTDTTVRVLVNDPSGLIDSTCLRTSSVSVSTLVRVPTLTPIGIAALAGLLGVFAVVAIRRRL
jgi:PKD repeat protein